MPTRDKDPTGVPQAVLDRLEEAALVAIIPGELVSWCDGVADAVAAVAAEIPGASERYGRVLDQILEADLEMSQRVESLREREESLARELAHLDRMVKKFQTADALSPEASREPTSELDALRRDLLVWVIRSRMLEKEVDAWYFEALLRDRGVAD